MTTPLTKQQAIEAMREGKKVRHELWPESDWMQQLDPFNLEYANGDFEDVDDFWLSHIHERWETGWSIVED